MAIKDEIAGVRKRMEKAIEDIRKELSTIRTGRASISILDSIQVDYYGVPTPINQVAQLATPEPTMITVQPYDVSLVGPIDKAIRASDLSLNPSNDGRLIRVPIPPLTEERRKQYAKHVHKVLEEHRTAVRNIPSRRQ
jgi:ribosome recycling factor